MALATLTFADSGYQSTGYTTPTDAQIIDWLIANAATHLQSSWRVISSSASAYIEFGGPTGSPVEDLRVIVGVNPTAGYLAPDLSSTGIWIGFTYDCDGQSIGTWNSTTPYGATVNFTGYTTSGKTGVTESIRFICSEETFGIFYRDDSLNTRYGTHLGAVIDPLTGDAMPDGCIYGMFTTGDTSIGSAFWNYQGVNNQWMTHGALNNNSHAYVFRPTDPTKVDAVCRNQANIIGGNEQLAYLNNDEYLPTISYFTNQIPRYQVGVLRQVYPVQERVDETVVSNGVILAASGSVAQDAMLFSNS